MKEQLEAAKPEPIIDEVVGKAGAGIPGNPELEIWMQKSRAGNLDQGIQGWKSGSGDPGLEI